MKPLGAVMRKAGWWLDAVERHGHSGDVLHHHLLDLITCVALREECTPEHALDLLRGGYLFRAIENAIENQPAGRHPAPASKEHHTND